MQLQNLTEHVTKLMFTGEIRWLWQKKSSETVSFINTGSYRLDAAHITLVGKNLWLDKLTLSFMVVGHLS